MFKKKNKEKSGLLIPAGLFLGIGIGMLFDQVAAGTVIGLGCAYVAKYFVDK